MTLRTAEWLGKIIHVRVRSVGSFGALVDTDAGLPGLIRRREMSWAEAVTPRLVLQPGDEIDALVVRVDKAPPHLELSYRRVQHDPWQEFVATHAAGSCVRGRVTHLQTDGAYIAIAPGVDGWLPLTEIKEPGHTGRIDDILWLGDVVEAVVTHIDTRLRRPRLSVRRRTDQVGREALRQRLRAAGATAPGMSIGERTGITSDALKAHVGAAAEPSPEAAAILTLSRPLRILIVDDESGIRETLGDRLERAGCRYALAADGAEARRLAETGVFDIIFVDVGLPDEDGIALANHLSRLHAGRAVIAVITGIPSLADTAARFEMLGSLVVLMKPLDWTELADLLQSTANGESIGDVKQPRDSPAELAMPEPALLGAVGTTTEDTAEAALRPLLTALQHSTRAERVAVFAMDPLTRAAHLVTQLGHPPIHYDPRSHPLEISPVKDVIIDRDVLYEIDVPANAAARFRYLQPLVDCVACIGVPVAPDAQERYGLFLFHSEHAAFSTADLSLAQATSIALAATLERVQTRQLLHQCQNLLLQGQLTAGLGHEVNNKLTKIALKALNLADSCDEMKHQARALSLSRGLANLAGEAHELCDWCRSLSETVRHFQTLMKHSAGSTADINRAVQVAQRILEPTAQKHKVQLQLSLAAALPPVPTSDVKLEHTCLNIMTNAVQQIAAFSPAGGTLHVSTELVAGDGAYPVKVRFRDDGPGIHRQWFERIFEFGFTSRPGGSGLGLYITRGLVESLGGRVRVDESAIFGGTTFLMELPAYSGEVADE